MGNKEPGEMALAGEVLTRTQVVPAYNHRIRVGWGRDEWILGAHLSGSLAKMSGCRFSDSLSQKQTKQKPNNVESQTRKTY